MFETVPLFGGIPGGPEMLIILLVLVLLFGANKIPKLARSTGQAIGEFQKGRQEIEEELQEMQEETEEVVEEATPDEVVESGSETETESLTESTDK